ncbi:hypothetical protein GCM10009116_15730 [Brevundimonas basaltis]|uniref:Uncharacterized protein n=1 Tax=Brevundimonas basaltis TaxID=472166 RepID=A0A7W8HY66_9CAUL|nr:hypothetical protein [Brevundimonas basaltis]
MAARRSNRGIGFDRDVKAFAPLFRLLQLQGIIAIREMLGALNIRDEFGPYGRGWNYGVLHRMLRRGAELGLCEGPRTRAAAALSRRL